MRQAAGLLDGVDVALDDVDDRAAVLRLDFLGQTEAVDVNRLLAEAIRDFLAADQQKLLVGAVQRVQPVNARQEIVIAQHQESIAMLPVPPRHIVRRRVAVAVERVRMRVALVPMERRTRGLPTTRAPADLKPLRDGKDTQKDDQTPRRATRPAWASSHPVLSPTWPA